MRILSILFTIFCSAAIYNLRRMVQDLEEQQNQNNNNNDSNNGAAAVNIYEKDVLTTTMYALGSGLALNVIIPGTEMMACAPYGIGAAALAARLHTFSLGGWTAGHWAYARRTGPKQLRSWVRHDVVGRLVEEARMVTGKGMGVGMGGEAGCSNAAEGKCEL
ncbi:hypothetical protein PG994_003039 [Apiospora phragmitis]|uniref:Uncharacterized protein n=1 Tax=Apiospora phragmitis TaxID=2905665 RepID=A0ABR1W6X7_9PEZI